MTTSDKAAEKLKEELLEKFVKNGLGYRVIYDTSALSQVTLSIKLDKESTGDTVMMSHGVKIILDQASADLLRDYELDYQDGPTGGFCLKTIR